MPDRHSDSLRGLSFDDLQRLSTTSTPPSEYILQKTPSRNPRTSASVVSSPRLLASTQLPQTAFHFSDPSPYPFAFRAGSTDMVQEQKPARNPLAPSQTRMPSSSQGSQKSPVDLSSSPAPTQNDPPIFGRPSVLNTNASPAAKVSARVTGEQKVIRRSNDSNYGNLFSKKRPGDVGYHKPPASGNPLANIGRDAPRLSTNSNEDSNRTANVGRTTTESTERPPRSVPILNPTENVVSMRGNTHASGPAWRPTAPQTFSSNVNTNPFYKPQSAYVDLTQPVPRGPVTEGFSDREVFGNDPFGTADPMMYIDSAKADENIKALLEGAMDDEADKPRTRRRKKELDAKIDSLSRKMQNMDVKEEEAEQEEEEEIDDGTREGLKVKLLPHQIDGVDWMQNKEVSTKKVKGILPKGGILADDMGLGKTIQSIALILANPRPSEEGVVKLKLKIDPKIDRATLVVAPLALIKQWEAELKDRIDDEHALNVKVHHGPSRTTSYKDLRKYDVVITTYQTLTSEHVEHGDVKTALFGVNWYRIILDEAHSIKNRNAKSTKAACALNAEYRWCLTGTPLQNNVDEIQSLINFLRIRPYNTLDVWREQITKPMKAGRGGLALQRLRAFLSAFMKRRTKDILKQDGALKTGDEQKSSTGFKIVKRTVECVSAEFNAQERAFYERLEARTDKSLERMMAGNQMSYASALVLLMRLRQACNHPRLLGADLSKEQDATRGSQTPSRKGSKIDDMDDIANMLGGLSVETKRCDICQIDLGKEEIEEGVLRCAECEEDYRAIEAAEKPKRKKEKKIVKKERKVNRRVVVDSDDEEESEITHESESAEEHEEEEVTDSEEQTSSEDDRPSYPTAISSTKIRHLLKILKNDCGTHKYIVFSFFTSMLDLIEPFLDRHDLRYVRYDGAMRNDAREASLESLRKNPDVRILLCSLRAGSLGLNLTAASRVVILEPFWNPFVEEQAIDRVHRLNQTQDVIVHKLTIKGSVEERILELQDKKRELSKHTIEGQKGLGAGKLTLKDMMRLFRHDAETDAMLDMIGMKDGRSLLDRDSESTSSASTRIPDEPRRQRPQWQKTGERKEDPIYGRRW